MIKLLDATPLSVSLDLGNEVRPVGQLLTRDRRTFFEFDAQFLDDPLPLSPLRLSARRGVIEGPRDPFDGLHGLFADSLPDAWGRLLLDRRVRQLGSEPSELSATDRLAAVGHRGIGALVYRPAWDEEPIDDAVDLGALETEAQNILVGEVSSGLEELFRLGGSPGGARPKVLVALDGDGVLRHGDVPRSGAELWLVKFRSETDAKDSAAVESTYHQLASDAGIEVPEARIFPTSRGVDCFGTRRFDRDTQRRWHVQTLSALLEADHRLPSVDAENALRAVAAITRDQREVLEMFRRIAFNVRTHNRDDHARQFTLRMELDGSWRMAPAYDLTCEAGPGGEHTMAVAGEARRPGRDHLRRAAAAASLRARDTEPILEQVDAAARQWHEIARANGVGRVSLERISSLLRDVESVW